MLTVWAVQVGEKYPPHYLHKLHKAVARNLRQPFAFEVLTDNPAAVPGKAHAPDTALWGWWQKTALFHLTRDQPPTHQNLYIDLDSVIVGGLDAMLEAHRGDRLAMPANWAQSGHGGCQSSVMIWAGGAYPEIRDDLTSATATGLWGDQEWITMLLGQPGQGKVAAIAHPTVVSYKYHCRETGQPPAGAAIVTFHGKPDPHEVDDSWVRACW
jgi:hypothetical protein